MIHQSPHTVVGVLRVLEHVGLECIGARVLPGDEIELRVAMRLGLGDPGQAIQQAWPDRGSHLLMERLSDITRARLLVAHGVWVSWQASSDLHGHSSRAPVPDHRLTAFEVRKGEGGSDEEVVMATSPDEAAAYYARGWGLDQGALVAVAWEEARGAHLHPALSGRHMRLYRVLPQGRVATLPG